MLGRCRAVNLCAYCARLAAVETSEMLALDAMWGSAPALWAVLTTREATLDTASFYESRRKVLKALKRRWPSVEAFWIVEFTTGYGKRSGGARRPHWNAMLKGIPYDDQEEVHNVAAGVWCGREDAKPQAQYVGAVGEAGGLMRYLALHFLKESQQPPAGWSGHRTSATRGYLWTDTPTARDMARASLREKRYLHAAIKQGFVGDEVEGYVEFRQRLDAETTWELVAHNPSAVAATMTP